jgi:hypothetical protein
MTGSQYWAGNDFSAFKLVSYQRSIANFVEILTGNNIPVNYATKVIQKPMGIYNLYHHILMKTH